MNIKSEEAHRLAKELSEKTGETVTEAVTVALRERLHRETHDERLERLRALQQRTAPLMRDVPDHAALLYDDETGLPR